MSCGYGFHIDALTKENLQSIYSPEYNLGQDAPDAERARAHHYAQVIMQVLDRCGILRPDSFVEFGCGMGSLAEILATNWQVKKAIALEPSSMLATYAQAHYREKIDVQIGFAEEWANSSTSKYDLCFSVNVLEHALYPTDFLAACSRVTINGGNIIIVCPDGEATNSELLFYDHVSSFSLASLSACASKVNLKVNHTEALEGPLYGFRLFVLEQNPTGDCGSILQTQTDAKKIFQQRHNYLQMWGEYETSVNNLLKHDRYAVFGIGEYANLLNAYAPQIIDKADYFVTDTGNDQKYMGRHVKSLDYATHDIGIKILAAVNERSWPALKKRLNALKLVSYHPTSVAG